MRTTPKPDIDIAQLFPELAPLAKETVRLHPRRGPEPGIAESKMGGTFLWPADEPWPVCDVPEYPLLDSEPDYKTVLQPTHPEHNDYYVGILQIRKEDVPELGFPEGKDLFQLFWCPRDHTNLSILFPIKIFWRNTKEIINPLQSTPKPKSPEEEYFPKICRLSPEKVVEFPHVFEFAEEFIPILDEKLVGFKKAGNRIYQLEFSVAPGTKVGGHLSWSQDPEIPVCKCGKEMQHLLTVDSEEGLHSTGHWCPIEDIGYRELSYEEKTNFFDTGLMLGDVGSIYLFICRHCEDWPIEWVFQCS